MSKFLEEYRRKRSPDRTPEPMGSGASRPGIFVVQKHSATRMHYDLRLEWDGVLKSWAVPRGPDPDPAEKRLAMQTEDHPVEYADFEGVIPDGEYGAGPMIVWDRGLWRPVGDPPEGVRAGKLLFELKGFKLKGMWTLVRIKGETGKEWLLIKETGDGHVRRAVREPYDDSSILSGLPVEDLHERGKRAAALREECERLKAPRRRVAGEDVQPMLAEPRSDPFDDPDWIFELKYDGFRAIASRDGARPRIFYRRGADSTAVFPDLARALLSLPAERFVADGEIVVLDESGRPVFQRLQKRALLTAPRDVERAAGELPATLFLFDLLAFDEFDLRPLPLVERKRLLSRLVPAMGPIRAVDHVEGKGRALYTSVRELGLEGVVAKRAQSAYRSGRFRDWQKVRADRVGDFAVVGFTQAEGSRTGFGSVHVAVQKEEGLGYVGKVGGGFSEKELTSARAEMEALRLAKPPCIGPLPPGSGHTWVRPKLVVEVRYKEITEDGLLRQPTFLRFRTDKAPEECVSQEAPPVTPPPVSKREVPFTNLDKVYWPEEGYTKGDLIEYYRAISPWLLPYLRNRPVVLTRFPDGIEGKSSYQKDAPEFAPDWMRTVPIWSEDTQRDIRYFVFDDAESILYIANMGSIPLHIWGSRVGSLELPDWCVIDLDPKEAPFSDVIRTAQVLHRICESAGLPNFVKTTGKTGLHIMLPLGRQFTYEHCRTLGELLARLVLRELNDIATITRHITKRGDKVYLDYLQNRHGQLIVAPYSVRPLPGASVSMPLEWHEVDESLDPRAFTIKTAVERMEKLGEDPVLPVLETKPDLLQVLDNLQSV